MRRLALLCALVPGVTACLPAPAQAARAECSEINPRRNICEVIYTADPAERNSLMVFTSGGTVTFIDRVEVAAGRNCTQLGPRSARCAIGTEQVMVKLAGGDDSMRVRGTFGPGPELQAELGAGDDLFAGGPGSEGAEGGTGLDRLYGGAGNDSLVAGAQRGRQILRGGAGDDDLIGGRGADGIHAGPGLDSVQGGGGQDRVHLRDGSIDRLACGPGRERPLIDAVDWVSRSCRVRPRPRAAAVPLGDELPEADLNFEDRLYEIGCPADGPPRCRGTVKVLHRSRLLLSGRFRARRGTLPLVRLKVPRGFRRPDRPRRVLARVLVTSRDRSGRRAVRSARVPFLIDNEAGIE